MKFNSKQRTLTGFCCAAAFAGTVACTPFAAAQVGASGAAGAQETKMLPDAKGLIDKAIAAMGGTEAFKKIESSHIAFDMAAGPQNISCDVKSMTKDKKDMLVAEMNITQMGLKISFGSDGDTMWQTNPMTGQYALMSEMEAQQMEGLSDMGKAQIMVGELKDNSSVLQTVGVEDFNGMSCHKIRVVPKDKKTGEAQPEEEFHFFIDKEKTLPRGMKSKQGGQDMTMTFGEWKDVNGLMLPTKLTGQQGPQTMTLTFTKTEFNTLNAATFELPAEVKELVAKKGGGAASQPSSAGGAGR